MTIKLMDIQIDGSITKFKKDLDWIIFEQIIRRFNVIQYKLGPHISKLIIKVEVGGQIFTLNFPDIENNSLINLDSYVKKVKPQIIDFKTKINNSIKKLSLTHDKDKLVSMRGENINNEKTFNTIENHLREFKKDPTPVIYTGMTN